MTWTALAAMFVGAAQLLPALGAGALLSRLVHQRIDARTLRVFVLSFSIVTGAVLMLRT